MTNREKSNLKKKKKSKIEIIVRMRICRRNIGFLLRPKRLAKIQKLIQITKKNIITISYPKTKKKKYSNLSPISLKSGIESSQPPKKRESFSLALDLERWYPI